MRIGGAVVVAVGLLGLLGSSDRAQAQAVAFNPTVSSLPDGVGLSVTPAVSADRRYVRLSLNVGFQTIDGFSNFPVPGAVSGGGNGGGGGGLGGLGGLGGGGGGGAGGGGAVGGGGGGGIAVVSGMNGPVGPGMQGGSGGFAPSMGPFGYGYGYGGPGFGDYYTEDWSAWRPAPKRSKVTRPKTTRPKAPAPAPVVTASKKQKP